MAFEDRTYHGVYAKGEVRIEVERPVSGPTERASVSVLHELRPADPHGGFGWGYNGGGTSRAASAILADALDLGDQDEAGISMSAYPEDRELVALREDFCEDVLMQCCDEWRLGRGAVLRWTRGWYAQRGLTDLPQLVAQLPPLLDMD